VVLLGRVAGREKQEGQKKVRTKKPSAKGKENDDHVLIIWKGTTKRENSKSQKKIRIVLKKGSPS